MSGITRRDFLAMAGVLGLGTALAACGDSDDAAAPDDLSILIVGAGAAGMSAGHLLAQRGVDFTILEAGPTYGGRIKHTRDFTDFPISLGGEWLHVDADTLPAIVNDDRVTIETELHPYDPEDLGGFYSGELLLSELGDAPDLKFVDSSWLDFFETYVLPSSLDRMIFDTQIVEVAHGPEGVVLTDASGTTWEADAVMVTVPLKVLQDGDVLFTPPLPDDMQGAIDGAEIWGGMKVFLEFTEAFYPAYLAFPDSETSAGQRIYYDAAYGQRSEANVLGLFSVGAQAEQYQELDEGNELRDHILAELDEIFDGRATATYVQHLAQNWNKEPFAKAAYLADEADPAVSTTMSRSVGDTLHFVGASYTSFDDWSSVHTAARSARDKIDEFLS